jgi:glycosyltransferase involved in cell wall biosynthesis
VPFQQAIGERVDRVVVHQHAGCRDRLLAQGIPAAKIRVIPHGTRFVERPDRAQARAALGLDPERPVALGLGFIHPRKGTHTLVRAFARVARRVPGAQLVIAGAPRRRNPLDLAYHAVVARLMRPGLREGWIDYRPGFHPAETVSNLLAAADVVAFAYRQDYGSASGILHTALGAGRPVLCARGFKFAEAHEAWGRELPELFPEPGDVAHWAEALTRVLSEAGLRAELAARAEDLGRQTAWPRVARQHLELYRDAVSGAT